MILSTKIVKALAGFAETDPLRSSLHGILFDPRDKSFNVVATDGKVLLRTNGLSSYKDDEDYPGYNGPTWVPEEPIHIGAGIFDIAKAIKKSKTNDAAGEILITGFNAAGKLNVVYNVDNTASVALVDAKYPEIEPVLPKEDVNYKHYFARIYNVDDIIRVAKACKDMGDKFIKFKFLADNTITLVTNHSRNFNHDYEILMTNANQVEESEENKVKKELVLEYSHGDLNSSVYSDWITADAPGIYTANSAQNYVNDSLYPQVCKDFYNSEPCNFSYRLVTKVNSFFNGDRIYYSCANNPVRPLYKTEEPLTPEEENALNELTDGPGSFDSAAVQIEACSHAEESIASFDEKVIKLYENAGKTVDEIADILTCTPEIVIEVLDNARSNFTIKKMFKEYTDIKNKYNEYIIFMKNENDIFTFYPSFEQLVKNFIQINTINTKYDTLPVRYQFKSYDLDKVISTLVNQGYKVLLAEGVDKITTAEPDPFPNTGKKWTREDEEKLEFLYKAGKTIEDLTEIFGRNEKGITSRLEKLGLIEQVQETKPVPAEKPRETLIVEGYLVTSSYIGKDKAKTKFKVTGWHPTTSGNTDVKPWLKLAEAYGIDITDEVIVYKESDPDNNIFYINRKSVFVPDEDIKTESTVAVWTDEDDQYLLDYFKEGCPVEELSEALNRPVSFIKLRLESLGAFNKPVSEMTLKERDKYEAASGKVRWCVDIWTKKDKGYTCSVHTFLWSKPEPSHPESSDVLDTVTNQLNYDAKRNYSIKDTSCVHVYMMDNPKKYYELTHNESYTSFGMLETIYDKPLILMCKDDTPAIPSGFIPIKHPIYCRIGKKVIDKDNKIHLIKAVNVGKGVVSENNIVIPFENLTHVSEK